MRRLQLGMTALALSLMGLFLLKFVDREGKPVTVRLAPQPSQPRVSPAEAGIDSAALEAAAEFAGKHGTRALVVGRNGHIVFEKYWQDTNFDTPVDTRYEPVLVALVLGTAFEDRLVVGMREDLSRRLGITPEEARYFVFTGAAVNTTYDPGDERINILFKDGSVRDISQVDNALIHHLWIKRNRNHYRWNCL